MQAYSPSRRTAVVFSGTGVHGAYHAGVLKAFHESGVKIDVVAGRGVGAGAAVLASIGGASRLWDDKGLWASERVRTFYRWHRSLQVAAWCGAVMLVAAVFPLTVALLGTLVVVPAFLLQLLGVSVGESMIAGYSGWLRSAFEATGIPTVAPRLAVLALGCALGAMAVGLVRKRLRLRTDRRYRGGWWWDTLAAPIDAGTVQDAYTSTLWELIRGASKDAQPTARVVGRRLAEVLGEGVGQPGFWELMIVASDLDTQSDVVATMLQEPYRHDFIAPRPGRERRAEVVDLAGAGREHGVEVMAAALVPPVCTEPYGLRFAPDEFWKGETHRITDRPGAVVRLCEELAAAGVSQVILVSAHTAVSQPHHVRPAGFDPRSRLGEYLETAETTALRDALEVGALRFDACYVIAPAHNPLGPFDVDGVYDEASARRQSPQELIARGYEDAYHQFIDPVVGASGEHLAATIDRLVTGDRGQGHAEGFVDELDPRR